MAYADSVNWLMKHEEGKKYLDDILNEVREKGIETKTVREKYKDYDLIKEKAANFENLLPVLKEHGIDESDIVGSIKNLSKTAADSKTLAPENADLIKKISELSGKFEALQNENSATKEKALKRTQAALTSKLLSDLKGKVGGAESAARLLVLDGMVGMGEDDKPYFKGEGDSVIDYSLGLDTYINGHAEKLNYQSGGAGTVPSTGTIGKKTVITRNEYLNLPAEEQSSLTSQNIQIID